MTNARLNLMQVAPEAYAALSGLGRYIETCGLEPALVELVKVRASQINACAFCLDMHSRDARRHGETEQRLYLLNAWRDAPGYSERERAALAWTECLTLVASQGAPDTAYEALNAQFTPKEIIDLTTLIGTINLWNRMMIGLRAHPDLDQASPARTEHSRAA